MTALAPRMSYRGFLCVDCGALLGEHDAIVCARCDRAEVEELRALLAPPADVEPTAEATTNRGARFYARAARMGDP